MKIELVIEQLRAFCPTFDRRVAGAAQFGAVTESTNLRVPCAFVIPLDDEPSPSASQNSVRVPLQDVFEVVIALDNKVDERGQASGTSIHAMRAELWKALLGWQPESDYNGITYEGGNVLAVSRAYVFWRFEFSAAMEIGPEHGWQEGALERLPTLEGVNFNLDMISPAVDPNIRPVGPDGRIEHAASSETNTPP